MEAIVGERASKERIAGFGTPISSFVRTAVAELAGSSRE
jgi:hypothetical protein